MLLNEADGEGVASMRGKIRSRVHCASEAASPSSAFRSRVFIAGLFALCGFAVIAWRMVLLQVVQAQRYALQADENRMAFAPIAPTRGAIVDRNGVVLARNVFAPTLEITSSRLDRPLDTVIDELTSVVPISEADRARFHRRRDGATRFDGVPIRTGLTDAELARFAAQRFRFPGVDIGVQSIRQYPLGSAAAHVVGYVGAMSELDRARIAALSDKNDGTAAGGDARLDARNYKGAERIGKTGIEQRYETELRGLAGFEQVETNASGRPLRTLARTEATPGANVILSLDIGLQLRGEAALAGHRGALVALDPSTGEVLAFVSTPSFDPNAFVGGIDRETWDALSRSADRPLLNRPLQGIYPPGSTYKPFMALAALTLGVRTPQWSFFDPGHYSVANQTFRNDVPSGHGTVDMTRAITVSNNTYFYRLAHEIGVDAIADFMRPWGFGQRTGIDLAGEARGVLPSTEWKKHAFARQPHWYDGDTVNLGNGQGYNAATLLQLAHAVATLANDGVAMTPRVVRAIEDPASGERRMLAPRERTRIAVKQQDLDVIKRAMQTVNMTRQGTAYRAFKDASFSSAGKTGTAQVFSLRGARYRREAVAERLRDHALYVGYAPADKPRIAVAVIIENGGWGHAAAPVARDVMAQWLAAQGA
jgi:penicillin-binding protein 2